ncbi:hypothetical protein Pelo_14196 [Pelomyxa schiedti]|nr:hypothetical protein Pelo_14196 [Pelomyxa schiedti]
MSHNDIVVEPRGRSTRRSTAATSSNSKLGHGPPAQQTSPSPTRPRGGPTNVGRVANSPPPAARARQQQQQQQRAARSPTRDDEDEDAKWAPKEPASKSRLGPPRPPPAPAARAYRETEADGGGGASAGPHWGRRGGLGLCTEVQRLSRTSPQMLAIATDTMEALLTRLNSPDPTVGPAVIPLQQPIVQQQPQEQEEPESFQTNRANVQIAPRGRPGNFDLPNNYEEPRGYRIQKEDEDFFHSVMSGQLVSPTRTQLQLNTDNLYEPQMPNNIPRNYQELEPPPRTNPSDDFYDGPMLSRDSGARNTVDQRGRTSAPQSSPSTPDSRFVRGRMGVSPVTFSSIHLGDDSVSMFGDSARGNSSRSRVPSATPMKSPTQPALDEPNFTRFRQPDLDGSAHQKVESQRELRMQLQAQMEEKKRLKAQQEQFAASKRGGHQYP